MHRIEFVDDDALPDGHDFMLVTNGSDALIFYRRSEVTPANLEDSWAAYRALRAKGTPPGTAEPDAAERHLGLVDSRPAS